MKSAINTFRYLLAIGVIGTLCHVKVAQAEKPGSDHRSSNESTVDSLPSVEHMLAMP